MSKHSFSSEPECRILCRGLNFIPYKQETKKHYIKGKCVCNFLLETIVFFILKAITFIYIKTIRTELLVVLPFFLSSKCKFRILENGVSVIRCNAEAVPNCLTAIIYHDLI